MECAALLGQSTEAANRDAVQRVLAAEPALTDVRRAGELIPRLDASRLVLHAGPPIVWDRMCGPLRGAICGAAVFEGWAPDLAGAEKLAASADKTARWIGKDAVRELTSPKILERLAKKAV